MKEFLLVTYVSSFSINVDLLLHYSNVLNSQVKTGKWKLGSENLEKQKSLLAFMLKYCMTRCQFQI